ncbi:PF06945 family protein [Leptospira alexanderi serovar Manhao 3 str. L 60]|uniref:PF06945 family protein n=2 Tax=Leptospira alexanderi TaxID=100053 RepID=V6HUJ1_9LEPT|nr:PF06945 family protein [Leptospira alexanderi serovar Manhao 3 str. L 60]
MDFESGYCQGCFRTIDEIGNWSRYSDSERENLFLKLKIRKEEIFSKELRKSNL